MSLDAEAFGERQVIEFRPDEINAFELLLLSLRQTQAPAAEFQNLILRVVADDKHDWNLVAGGGPQTLHAVSRRPFAEQRQHRPIRPGEFRPNRHTEAPSQR